MGPFNKLQRGILGGLLISLVTGSLCAQQLPLLNEYLHYPALLNPAMVGWEDITAITATYRYQWTEMPERPMTFGLNFRHFDEPRNMAFGGGLTHDQTGPTSFTGGNLQYAYHLKFKSEKPGNFRRHRLALGLSLSATQYRLDGSSLRYNDANDPLIVNNTVTRILPDAALGAFYYNDLYYVGIALPQLISRNVRFESDNSFSNLRREVHAYLHAGVKIRLQTKGNAQPTNEHILLPTLWLRYVPNTPFNIHLHLRYWWRQQFGLGIAATTDGTLTIDAALQLKCRLRIGYALGIPLHSLAPQLGTNHELALTYILGSRGRGWLLGRAPQQLRFRKKKKSNAKQSTSQVRE